MNSNNLEILIVDDNPSFVKALEILLKTVLGIKLVVLNFASNGVEAIEKTNSHGCYDYIFMDVNMPIMDGIATTKLINREFSRNTKIIAISFNNDLQTIKNMIFSGALRYISKGELTFELLRKMFERDGVFKDQQVCS